MHAGRLLVPLLAAGVLAATGSPAAADLAPGTCSPAPDVGCVAGTVRDAAGGPVAGVRLGVEGPGGSATAVTDAEGRWAVAVPEAGEYGVTIDATSLPSGAALRDPSTTTRTVTVALGSSSGALFPLAAGADGGGGAGGPASPAAASATPTSRADDAGTDGPVAEATATGGGDRVAQQLANGLVFGLLLALASVGLSLVYGTTGLSSFSHGEQVTLGAVVAYVLARLVGVPLPAAAAAAVLVGGLSGWLQDAAIWRPLRRRRIGTTQQMIVTIGLSMALQYLFQLLLGGGRLRIETRSSTPVHLGPVVLSAQTLASAAVALVVLAGVAAFLLFTRAGRAARAVSDNPALAAASGIGVERVVRTVWVGATALAALGGVLTGLYFQATTWNMGGTILLLMFASVTLGGLGTAFGALAGSMVIGVVSEMASLVIPSDMRFAAALAILILVLLVRPQGILGRRERIG